VPYTVVDHNVHAMSPICVQKRDAVVIIVAVTASARLHKAFAAMIADNAWQTALVCSLLVSVPLNAVQMLTAYQSSLVMLKSNVLRGIKVKLMPRYAMLKLFRQIATAVHSLRSQVETIASGLCQRIFLGQDLCRRYTGARPPEAGMRI